MLQYKTSHFSENRLRQKFASWFIQQCSWKQALGKTIEGLSKEQCGFHARSINVSGDTIEISAVKMAVQVLRVVRP
jgi:hypothetical protein